MFKMPSLPLQMKSWARCLGGRVFLLSRGNHIFLQFPFWYMSDLCIAVRIRRFGLRLSFYLSQRVSFCSRCGFFYYTSSYFVPIEVIEDRVTKINAKSFNGILWPLYLFCLINSIFICSSPQSLAFEKFLFELDALSYGFKITCILVRQDDGVLSKIYYFNLMVSYLYSFNPYQWNWQVPKLQ